MRKKTDMENWGVDREIVRHVLRSSYKQRLDWLEQSIKFFRKTLSPKAKRALLKKMFHDSVIAMK